MKKLLIILAFLPLLLPAQTSDFPIYFMRHGRAIGNQQQTDTVILINMLGQSNIDGNALISGLTGGNSKYTGELNAYIFDSTNFNKINTTTNNNQFPVSQQDDHFGPELSLSYLLDSLNTKNIYINKYAIGGTYLYQHPSLQDWNVNSSNQLYNAFKQMRARAISALSGKIIASEYVIWYQGERDATSLVASNLYSENLEEFIDSVNTLTDSCKFYCVRIHTNTDHSTYEYWDTIRGSQYYTFQNHTNVELVTVDSYPLQSDSTHLTVQGEIDLGRKLAIRINNDVNPPALASSYLARITGYTKNYKTKVVNVFDSLDYYDISDSLRLLYVFHTDIETWASYNWMSSNYTLTPVNTPTFYVDSGYKFTAAQNEYLNTNYNPSTDGGFNLTSLSFGIYSNTNIAAALYSDIGLAVATKRIYLSINFSSSIFGWTSTTSTSGSNTVNTGLFSATRLNNAVKIYRDSGVIVTGTRTDAELLNGNIYIGALNTSGTPSQYSNRSYSYMFLGSTRNIPKIYSIMNEYMYGKLIF